MTDSTRAFFLWPIGSGEMGSAGLIPPVGSALHPEGSPSVLWGQGTPNGDLAPFSVVNKGSIYLCVNNTDDQACIYQKVDEGGDNNDWVLVFAENHAKIDTSDIAAAAAILLTQMEALDSAKMIVGSSSNVATERAISGDITISNTGVVAIASAVIVNADVHASAAIVGSKLASNARRQFARTPVYNIDNGNGTTADYIILVPSDGITIIAVRFIYTEATDTAGVASANVKVGTAVGGAELVAATAYEVSKAVGTHTAMALETGAGAVAADGMVAVRHTGIASTEAGEGFVQIEFTVDD